MSDREYMERVRAMERKLYRIAHGILWSDADCADAIQEAVFKGWIKRGTLREEAYFETWLNRILINECKNIIRRRRGNEIPMEEAPPLAAASEDSCERLQLRRALRALPDKYRILLLLHYLEGYAQQEIAQMLGIPPALVKSRMHQARSMLRKTLGEDSHER